MAEDGRLPAKILVKLGVLRNRVDPLFTPNHVRDSHQVVVHDIGEVVSRKLIGFKKDLVVNCLPVLVNLSAQEIPHDAVAAKRYLHPHHEGLTVAGAADRDFRRDVAAISVITRKQLLVAIGGAHLLEPLLSAKAAIGIARLDKSTDVLAVDFRPLALPVRGMGTADVGTLIPRETNPAQGFQDRLLGLPGRARSIRIFDAKDELPSLLPGEDVVEKGLVGSPD